MKITNHTSRVIPLPSRHKLRPGVNKGIPQSVRTHADNREFLNGEVLAGRISFDNSPAATPSSPPEQKRENIAPEWKGGTVTRRMLAKMRRQELEQIGMKLGKLRKEDVTGLNVEDNEKREGLRTIVARAVLGEL